MDKIMNFVDKISLEKILPKIDSILDVILWLMQWAVKLGPICILVLGLIYMLIPPKEANRYFGYRTYFGMGSISAWLFTQRVAGALMTLTGLVLYLIAKKAAEAFVGMEYQELTEKALGLLKGQVIAILVIYVFMFLLTMVMFNHKGVCRFPGIKNTIVGKLIPDEPVPKKKKRKKIASKAKPVQKLPEETTSEEVLAEEAEAEEEIPVEYERQGEQVITVDDIVIEGLDE